ncbi:transcriptional regulator [Pseudoruegeria sp. HB172150]|uniref:winged helix-turn-helix domain-containing protein n=1 Tax=Pseudoruegeria sp. HB172150 TaxID=2721164 RepID=UPI0015576B1B|nr:transcriptional regulator [Pseudoruegeria sp. HB172150]
MAGNFLQTAPDAADSVFHVGRWRVDPAARHVTNGIHDRRLSPRAMRLLQELAEAGGDVITRESLLERVWPDVVVGDDSLTQAIAELRRVFEDPKVIETIPKRGYRLTASVLSGVEPDHLPFADTVEDFDLAAYSLCLESRMVLSRSGAGALERSELLAREAVQVAPTFAMAQADLSVALVQRHLYSVCGLAGLTEALECAEAAVRLRPDLPAGHMAMGFALGAVERWSEAKAAFARAISRDLNDPDTHYLAARTMFAAGDVRTSAALAERAGQLNLEDYRALYLAARAAGGFDSERGRRNAEASLYRVRTRLARDPNEPRALNALAPLLAHLGEVPAAATALEADEVRGSPLEFYNAVTRSMVGDTSGALDALESVAERGWSHPAWLRVEPSLSRLSAEPRFQRLSRQLGAA